MLVICGDSFNVGIGLKNMERAKHRSCRRIRSHNNSRPSN